MDITFLQNCILALMAMIVAGMLIAKYRRFFERKPGEPWPLFLQRAAEEKRRDAEARNTMFGSRSATNRANLLTFGLGVGFTYAVFNRPLMYVLLIYLAVGFYVSRSRANAAKTSEYARLSISDRLWFRLYFAWTWIFHARGK